MKNATFNVYVVCRLIFYYAGQIKDKTNRKRVIVITDSSKDIDRTSATEIVTIL